MIATFATENKNAREDLEQTATYCLLVYFSPQRPLQSLESGFHMIATIATIVEIELRSILAIVVATIATIAEEWFPYDRNDR